jgi:hypothetical protein
VNEATETVGPGEGAKKEQKIFRLPEIAFTGLFCRGELRELRFAFRDAKAAGRAVSGRPTVL